MAFSVESDLQRISDVIIDIGMLDELRDDVASADSNGLRTDERMELVDKYFRKIIDAFNPAPINHSTVILYLNYIFGAYWGVHKLLRVAVDYNFPEIKHSRTYGVRGEADYLRAVTHRNILEHTNNFLSQLEKKNFEDEHGRIYNKAKLLKVFNEIVSKQPALKYELDSEMTIDTPQFKETLTKDVVSYEIDKSINILREAQEDGA